MCFDIVIVGCGGTGGNLIARLARFLSDYDKSMAEVNVTICDEDIVEYKNISRQCFTTDDIGMVKSVALSKNLESVFGVRFRAYPKYITSRSQLESLFERTNPFYSSSNRIEIVIGCTDNHASRKVMRDWLYGNHKSKTSFLIDSANETSTGEIVISKYSNYKVVAPDRFVYYPSMKDDLGKAVTEMSCEELNQSTPQHFATNCLAADNIFSYLSIMLMHPDYASELRGGICYFDSSFMFSRFDKFVEGAEIKANIFEDEVALYEKRTELSDILLEFKSAFSKLRVYFYRKVNRGISWMGRHA